MTITLQSTPTTTTRVVMGTLTNGELIHAAFARMARELHIPSATFELLGGLTEVELTAYDFVRQERQPALVFTRPLEIIAGYGTISWLENEPHVHTHLTLSFRDAAAPHGIAVIGGHAARAVAFAVEFTLHIYDGEPVRRAMHPATGLQLWALPTMESV